MLFNLVKKIVSSKDGSKTFTNLYLVAVENDITIPIVVKSFKGKDGKMLNKSDFILAVNLAVEEKNEKDNKK